MIRESWKRYLFFGQCCLLLAGFGATPLFAQAEVVSQSISRWNPSFAPAPGYLIEDLQALVDTPGGGVVFKSQAPGFLKIKSLKPSEELDRKIVGALGLGEDFDARLKKALDAKDHDQLESLSREVIERQQHEDLRFRSNVALRVRGIVEAIREGKMGQTQLYSALEELRKIDIYGRGISNETLVLLEISKRAANQTAARQAALLVLPQAEAERVAPELVPSWYQPKPLAEERLAKTSPAVKAAREPATAQITVEEIKPAEILRLTPAQHRQQKKKMQAQLRRNEEERYRNYIHAKIEAPQARRTESLRQLVDFAGNRMAQNSLVQSMAIRELGSAIEKKNDLLFPKFIGARAAREKSTGSGAYYKSSYDLIAAIEKIALASKFYSVRYAAVAAILKELPRAPRDYVEFALESGIRITEGERSAKTEKARLIAQLKDLRAGTVYRERIELFERAVGRLSRLSGSGPGPNPPQKNNKWWIALVSAIVLTLFSAWAVSEMRQFDFARHILNPGNW